MATGHRFIFRLLLLAVIVCTAFIGADQFGALTHTTLTDSVQAASSQPPTTIPPRVGRAVVTATNDWLQFGGNAQHTGDIPQESIISTANVGTLSQLFQVALPAIADGAPAYLSQVATSTGTRDLLFVTTKAGDIVALDAHTGAQIWRQSYPAGSCLINNGSVTCYTTSSPAVDPNRQFVYGYGLDGNVHKYAVGTGTEVTVGGWPERATLKGFVEKGSSALSIVTAKSGVTYLYVTSSGYPGDQGDYQGHVTAINLSTGAQNVFNANCSNQTVHFVETPGTPDCTSAVQSAIWARPGTIYDATLDRILMVTGNGPFAPSAFDWGDRANDAVGLVEA